MIKEKANSVGPRCKRVDELISHNLLGWGIRAIRYHILLETSRKKRCDAVKWRTDAQKPKLKRKITETRPAKETRKNKSISG